MQQSIISEAGIVEAVFAHRFVLRRKDGTRLLADLGPEGAKRFRLLEGATLTIEGEAKPSELKVRRLIPEGGEAIVFPGKHDPADDAGFALAAARSSGLETVGAPRRKPKHFEILARRGGALVELHVALDGKIGREAPADQDKWAAELRDG